MIGLGIILVTCLSDHDFEYKSLKQNTLIFDHYYLDDLKKALQFSKEKVHWYHNRGFSVVLLNGIIFFISIEFYSVPKKRHSLFSAVYCLGGWVIILLFFGNGCYISI